MSPAPTKGLVTISAEETIKSVSVFFQTGRLIFAENVSALNHTFDISQYADGVYCVEIETFNTVYKHVVLKR